MNVLYKKIVSEMGDFVPKLANGDYDYPQYEKMWFENAMSIRKDLADSGLHESANYMNQIIQKNVHYVRTDKSEYEETRDYFDMVRKDVETF